MKHADDNTESSQLTNAAKNLKTPQEKHACYEHLRGSFWVLGDDGSKWLFYTQQNLRKRLRLKLGLDGTQHQGAMSEVDIEIERIMNEQYVDVALALAGYNSGLYTVLGKRILVVESPKPLLPVEGDHTRFLSRMRRMFGQEQTELFCGWLKFALGDYYEFLAQQTGRNVGMALVVSGSSGLGKTFLVDLLAECFGGRRAQPAQYAKGGTGFNNDLIAKELQVLDDDGLGDSYKERKEMGDLMKRIVAVRDQRCHPKGKDAIMVRVFWRLIYCLNDEAENLQVLPPLERGVQDKLMMLKATGALLDEAEEHRPRQENWLMLLEEVTWFIRWVIDEFEPDQTLLDARFGMKAWHHPDLVEGVDSFAPEFRLLDMIGMRVEAFDKHGEWTGTARELEVLLKMDGTVTTREACELLRSPGSIGKYLGKLSAKRPEAVQRLKKDSQLKVYRWRVVRPKHEPAVATQPAS